MLGWLPRRSTVATILAAALTTSAWAAPAALGTAGATASAAGYRNAPDRFERRIVYWTNVHRRRHGLDPLAPRFCPNRHAEPWARHLARTGRFYHQDVTEMFSCNGVRVAGENLARGYARPRAVVAAWMRSRPHRQNLLDDRYTHIGVGGARRTADGRMYVSQTFTGR